MAENIQTISEFGAEAQIKNEVYRLLITDTGIHMPPIKEFNYDYIAGVLWGLQKGILLSLSTESIAFQE